MDCHEANTGLSPYFDGELPRDDAAAIAAHLTACDGCRRSFDELRLISTVMRAQQAGWCAPSRDLRAKVMAALDDAPSTRVRQRAGLRTRLILGRLRRIGLRSGPR